MRLASSALASLSLLLTLAGCVTGGPTLDVQVAATSEPGAGLNRAERLCFSDTAGFGHAGKPPTKEHQQELIKTCSNVARAKGLEVVSVSAKTDCLLTFAASDATSLELQFFTKAAEGARKAHTIKVTTMDTRPSEDTSAHGVLVAMCRAAFQDYPEDLHAKTYAAGTELPQPTTKNKLASENCQPSPTYIWQIPRLRCTRPSGEVCIREYDREASAADCVRAQ